MNPGLTELGLALGCDFKATTAPVSPKRDGTLPERCYYAGPLSDLGPPPAPRRPRIELVAPVTHMDREAAELRQRADADLMRFFQQMARRRKGVTPRTIDSFRSQS